MVQIHKSVVEIFEGCPACGSTRRHRRECPLKGTGRLQRLRKNKNVQEDMDEIVEGGVEPVHSYVSFKQDYTCQCGEKLELGEQHWTDNRGNHLCKIHAAEEVKNASRT